MAVIVYVDDALIAASAHDTRVVIDGIKAKLELRTEGPLNRFLGCDVSEARMGTLGEWRVIYDMRTYATHCREKIEDDPAYKQQPPSKREVKSPATTCPTDWTPDKGVFETTCKAHIGALLYASRWGRPTLA